MLTSGKTARATRAGTIDESGETLCRSCSRLIAASSSSRATGSSDVRASVVPAPGRGDRGAWARALHGCAPSRQGCPRPALARLLARFGWSLAAGREKKRGATGLGNRSRPAVAAHRRRKSLGCLLESGVDDFGPGGTDISGRNQAVPQVDKQGTVDVVQDVLGVPSRSTIRTRVPADRARRALTLGWAVTSSGAGQGEVARTAARSLRRRSATPWPTQLTWPNRFGRSTSP